MREILFRGKRTDNGEWVEGYYSYSPEIDKHMITTSDLAHPCGTNFGFYKVIPETVCQYTGLTDKNGRKIFEGDIVAGTAYSSEWIGVIVWIDEIATFGVRYFHRTDPTAWQNSSILTAVSRHRQDKFAAQVIGNIYDNPELLEVKQNG